MIGKYEDLFSQKNQIYFGQSPRKIRFFLGGINLNIFLNIMDNCILLLI